MMVTTLAGALCLILKHRLRVVQDFGPFSRRIKCKRCGGDWVVCDALRLFGDWDRDLERIYRDMGFEILEPLPGSVEPPTLPEVIRAGRWPGALSIFIATSVSLILEAAGFGPVVRFIVVPAIGYASMRLLMRRAYERKCNSLRA